MRKLLTILLSLHILLAAFMPGWEMHELVKVPYLISHYQDHRHSEKNDAFGFIDFLELHYGDKAQEHRQQKHTSDNSLPFQNHNHQFHSVSIFIPVTNTSYVSIPLENRLKLHEIYSHNFSSEFSFSIWQPPKFS
jgi:hypothetical protein